MTDMNKEDLNMARIELNDETLEEVVGGVFQFFKGGTRCKVQGTMYKCNADAQFKLINLFNANPEMTESEALALALQQGILWT